MRKKIWMVLANARLGEQQQLVWALAAGERSHAIGSLLEENIVDNPTGISIDAMRVMEVPLAALKSVIASAEGGPDGDDDAD